MALFLGWSCGTSPSDLAIEGCPEILCEFCKNLDCANNVGHVFLVKSGLSVTCEPKQLVKTRKRQF